MHLMRLGESGAECPVVRVDDEHYIDVSDEIRDFDGTFFAGNGLNRLRSLIDDRARDVVPFAGERIGAPIAKPVRILCVGLNSSDLAQNAGLPVPQEPMFSFKSPETLAGANDPVWIPRESARFDWEIELGVVIGQHLYRSADPEEAHQAIAGYTVVNDITDRAPVQASEQWGSGKSAESSTPTGPWLATPDELPAPRSLGMRLDVNSVRRQNGLNANLIFSPAEIIRHISQTTALEPGDLVCTGTLPGIGIGSRPPTWLKEGDVMDLTIRGLGSQRQQVSATK